MFGFFGKKKEAPPPKPKMDMNEMLINMKMKSKSFSRESTKAMKEKEKYYKKAKETLQKGNEEGAKMFCELAQQKHQEGMQYLRMSHRLEVMAGQIKSKSKSMEMMDSLNGLTPFLEQTAQNMPIEQMYQNLDRFSQAYDNLSVQGHILDEGIEKTMGNKNTVTNVDNMMNQLKAEVNYELTGDVNTTEVKAKDVQNNQITQETNNFYDDLKNL